MTRKGKCKYCGSDFHWSYQCRLNPKRGKVLARKYKQAYKTGKTPKHDKLLSNQPLDRKRLIMELDRYCSLIVRISASNQFGIAECYTCGKRIPWKYGDCGHYRSRQHLQSRFDIDKNLRICCQSCNRLLHGNLVKYRQHLVREIGEEAVREVETRPTRKISTPELQEMLDEMKTRYKKLIDERANAFNSCQNHL